MRDISNENQIVTFLHCGLCLEEVLSDAELHGRASPRDYARFEVGYIPQGIQIWCTRHNCNVLHVDFEGQKHPANTTRKKRDGE